MSLKIRAVAEIVHFLVHQPTPEQIIAFHPSPKVAERAYELIYIDRDGLLTEEQHQELDTYMVIENLMRSIKIEARQQLKQQTP